MKYFVSAFLILFFLSCKSYENPSVQMKPSEGEGYFHRTEDGEKIFVYEYLPDNYEATIYLTSGITGINHRAEKDVIQLLSQHKYRIVVIHPRGTGFSDGKRGSLRNFNLFLQDFIEIINGDQKTEKKILFGHSMSCALSISIAGHLESVDAMILVNPPVTLKEAGGMSPTFAEYVKYAGYMIFSPHKPVVNMAGDPALIENEEDRRESESRINDPLLVKYFSMHMMLESKKMMDKMVSSGSELDIPLLLVYGEEDSIIEEEGCKELFEKWFSDQKEFLSVPEGTHGKKTIFLSEEAIHHWMQKVVKPEMEIIASGAT